VREEPGDEIRELALHATGRADIVSHDRDVARAHRAAIRSSAAVSARSIFPTVKRES
jgi:hypothetical protein